MEAVKKRLPMALVLFAVVAGFYWKLTLTRQYDWLWSPDLAQQVLPWFQEQARFWGKGGIPLWDPYVWAGQPLLGQAQPGTAYPLNWILFALPLRSDGFIHSWALEWYFVVMRLMAMAFCYWLCRDQGCSRIASLLAGAIFALGGYIGDTGWPQMVNGAVWLPLVFLFLLRAGRGQNVTANAALSGMFLGISWLSGHHQAPMFLSLAAAGAWLYYIFRTGRLDWRFVKAAVIAMLFTALTGALQILPAYEYGHLARRWAGAPEALAWNQPVPYKVHEKYVLRPSNLLGTVFPDVKTDADPFVGVAGVCLALIGLAVCWRDWRVRLLAAVALGGLLYSLGNFSLFQGFLYGAVPDLDKARVVSAAVVVFEFGAAVLAAFGVDQLASPASSPWPRRVLRGVLVFGFASLALFQGLYFVNKSSFPGPETVMLTPFLALGVAAVLFATLRGSLTKTQGAVLLVMIALLELGNNTGSVVQPRSDAGAMRWLNQMRGNGDIADFLKKEPGFPRATVADDLFVQNWGAMHGVEMWGGQLAGLTANIMSFEFWKFQSRMLWGVNYTISSKPAEEGGTLVFTGASGLKVYKHADAFPRAWAVHELLRVPDRGAGNRMINERLSALRRIAFLLDSPPALQSCAGPDEVALQKHTRNIVVIRANMACTGMVVLSDTYFPGWHADIDGHSAAIYEVNEAMRGVVVPAGMHNLTLRYRPASVIWGALFTLLGVSGALTLRWSKRFYLSLKIGGRSLAVAAQQTVATER